MYNNFFINYFLIFHNFLYVFIAYLISKINCSESQLIAVSFSRCQ